MSFFTCTKKNEEIASKINNGLKFTENNTLKYHDVNEIVKLLLSLKEQIVNRRQKQIEIMAEYLKGSLYSYHGFNFTLKNGRNLGNMANEVGFFFDLGDKQLYMDVEISSDILVDIKDNFKNSNSSNHNRIILYLIESMNLRNSENTSSNKIPYTINFYIDPEKKQLFSKIDGIITYEY